MAERAFGNTAVLRKRRNERVEEQALEQAPEHGLLGLQRAAGNRAVAQLLREPQATKARFIISKVAIAPGEDLYGGKCDADLSSPTADVKWSRGLMGKDHDIIFECGPQSFHFHTFRPWFDDDHFPWTMETTDDKAAFVIPPIAQALDDIYDDYEDAGSKFWGGYHTVKDGLKSDLNEFCGS